MKRIVLTLAMVAGLTGFSGAAQAHNLLLVAGNPQIVIFKLTSGDVVVTKVLADKNAGELNDIAPAGGQTEK